MPRGFLRPSTHNLRVNIYRCRHTFCFICIHEWSKIKMVCPICKRSIAARRLESDLVACAMVDDIEVRCFYGGCKWQGVESERLKHQRFCSLRPKNDDFLIQKQTLVIELTEHDESNEDSSVQILSDDSPWSNIEFKVLLIIITYYFAHIRKLSL